ncbi:hypothetical protein V501_01921, partial [Pseudogymnoascus sp. VKM F-4519 (FW-2642)]
NVASIGDGGRLPQISGQPSSLPAPELAPVAVRP